jgi:DNA invertase Pin-like site-specific DNA recombinase
MYTKTAMDRHNTTDIVYFLYARKSTESEDRQVQSIDDQIDRLLQLTTAHGWKVKEILKESRSAKLPNARPLFNNMLDRIEQGEANGILCWQINRLSRNPVDSGRVQWLLQRGVIRSIQTIDGEKKPTDNAVVWSVEAGVANQFILDLVKNVRRGLYSKVSKGWLPCRAPVGYLNDPVTRTIIADPERFPLVKRMWELLLTGRYTANQIADMASIEWGLTTRSAKRLGGIPISRSGVYRVFSNPFYCGTVLYGGNEYKGRHTPVVTKDDFDRAQEILGRPIKYRVRKHTFIYRGLLQCGECGCMITAERKRKTIKATGEVRRYVYYHCTRRKPNFPCTQRKCIREDDITRQFLSVLSQHNISPDFYSWAMEKVKNEQERDHDIAAVRAESVQRAINEIHKQIANLTGMRYRELIDDEQFLREKKQLQEKLRPLQPGLDPAERSPNDTYIRALEFALRAKEKFEGGSPEIRKEIIRGLCSNPTLINGKLNIVAAEWLQAASDNRSPVAATEYMLEPEKSPPNSVQDAYLYNLNLIRCSRWDAIRTALSDLTKGFYIPNLADDEYDTHDKDRRKVA